MQWSLFAKLIVRFSDDLEEMAKEIEKAPMKKGKWSEI